MSVDVVWQGVGANVAGAVFSGIVAIVSALIVVRRTNHGAEKIARQERLEAALGELIQAVSALYDPQLSLSMKRDRDTRNQWAPRFAQARTRVLILTKSDELDASLQHVVGEWESQWRRLWNHLADWRDSSASVEGMTMPGEWRPPTVEQADRARERLERMPGDLQRRLRELHEPSVAAATLLSESLGEWHAELERQMNAWPESRRVNRYG